MYTFTAEDANRAAAAAAAEHSVGRLSPSSLARAHTRAARAQTRHYLRVHAHTQFVNTVRSRRTFAAVRRP